MPDNLKNTGKKDDQRINVNQIFELQYWAIKLGISMEKLVEVVKQVGPMVKDVKKFLGK
jgi:hypothetical protein